MGRIVDRLLALFVPKAEVAAGCSTYTWCADCPLPRAYLGRLAHRQCCLNEGCNTWYEACQTC